jgi:hypothetical protein
MRHLLAHRTTEPARELTAGARRSVRTQCERAPQQDANERRLTDLRPKAEGGGAAEIGLVSPRYCRYGVIRVSLRSIYAPIPPEIPLGADDSARGNCRGRRLLRAARASKQLRLSPTCAPDRLTSSKARLVLGGRSPIRTSRRRNSRPCLDEGVSGIRRRCRSTRRHPLA